MGRTNEFGVVMNTEKKRAAAVSAVLAYIRKEEESRSATIQAPALSRETPNLWGVGGRQSQMQMRTMMQLKAFHGWRPR
jgi:hypothetical protein